MSWQSAALGDLCDIEIGKTPSRAEPSYWRDGTLPWLSIADMNQGRRLASTKECITEAGARAANMKPVKPGTLLLSYKLSIGKVGIAQIPLYTNEAIAALSNLGSDVDPDFMYWALQHVDLLRGADRAAMGATLNKAKLNEIRFPVPPLTEQRRIAAILDKADALRAKRREAIAKLDQLLQSVFLDMFGDASGTNATVEDLAAADGAIRTGPFGSQLLHSEFVDSGVAVLGIDNVVSNRFIWAKPRFITEQKYAALARYTVSPGDVLITLMGTCGRCAVVPEGVPTAVNTKHLCCISLDRERCDPEFLHSYFLMHPLAKSYLEGRVKGAIMSGLNMGIIKEMPVALPPIERQREFVSLKAALRLEQARLGDHLSHSDQFFESLQHRAFAGTL